MTSCEALLGRSLLLAVLLCAPTRLTWSQDEDEPVSGLIASFFASRDEEAKPRAVRIDPDLTWSWDAGAPDARVPADGFRARWTGSLLIQTPGKHKFFARTDGALKLKLGDRVVLEGAGGAFKETPVELPPGLASIELEYRHESGRARLAIDWEGPGFEREPLPARLLYHEPKEARAASADRFEEGRRLADRLGCANCHAILDLPKHREIGPPLRDAAIEIEPEWLDAWLANPAAVRPHTPMPGFGGGLNRGDLKDLVVYLRKLAPRPKPPTNEVRMALNVADPARGRLIFRSAGCLGCHTKSDEPGALKPAERAGPDLAGLARKRTSAWVASALEHPKGDKIPSRHRPDLKLSADDAAHVGAYLGRQPVERALDVVNGNADAGRALAERLRCAACHAIPGLEMREKEIPLQAGAHAHAGCLADRPVAGVPRFALSESELGALRALVSALPARPSPTPRDTLAADTMRRLNCFGCHTRDAATQTRLGSQLAGYLADDQALGALKGRLTPPNLTAVGDKLRLDYLALAVRGQAPSARPWLTVQMPIFSFAAGEADAICSALQQHDRMESAGEAPKAQHAITAVPKAAAMGIQRGDANGAQTATAAVLIGQRGFGCISCHVLAGKIPPGGEAETLGPDLALAHRRMTERYFDRWVANPQRIIPGTPMPQFVKPIESSPGSLSDQLAEIWQLLGNERLVEVASAATREILRPRGQRAAVVRDMVILEGAPGTPYTPRGLAIGLVNGQSLLFDTDRLTWLAYWRGGFLSRTKSGRLWEWRPEGERLWTARDRLAPVVFVGPGGEIAAPEEVRERFGSFTALTFEGDGVFLEYALNGPQASRVLVQERVRPLTSGWERSVTVQKLPAGYKPALTVQPPDVARPLREGAGWTWPVGPSRYSLRLVAAEGDEKLVVKPAGAAAGEHSPSAHYVPMPPAADGAFRARMLLKLEDGEPAAKKR